MRLTDKVKIDIGLTSSNLNNAGTGPYYNMGLRDKAVFIWEIGAMAAAATSIGQIMQATNAVAGGAKAVTDVAATITANSKVAGATLTCDTVLVADTVTINGITFTAAAAADLANRKFDQSVSNNATAASLAAAINHATAGVPGVTATAVNAVVTLAVKEPGEMTITASASAATVTVATTRALGYIEVDASMLDLARGFNYVALRVTNSAQMQTGAIVLRGQSRYSPIGDQVAAAKK